MITNDLLTARETADYLRISNQTLYRWVKTGKLKQIQINVRGDRRFKKEDILELLK